LKKILVSFLCITTLLVLLGCGLTTTLESLATTTTSGDTIGVTSKEIAFTNLSTQFLSETAGSEINFYYFSARPDVPCVDISEFITLLDGLIDETTQVSIEDDHTIKVFIHYELTAEEMEEYGTDDPIVDEHVLFDFAEETVSAKNIDSFDYFSGESETDFGAGLDLVDSFEEELPAFVADVSEYGFAFEIIQMGGATKYVLPLSLADLFLTGSMFDVVQNGTKLYGIDTYQLGELPDEVAAKSGTASAGIKEESKRYLAFVFDFFYGLKDYRGIASFSDYVETQFADLTPFESGLYTFVDSLADMHTGIITTGHYNPDYSPYEYYEDYPLYVKEYFNSAYGCNCEILSDEENFTLEIDEDDIAYLRINSFTEEFSTELAPYMEQIRAANVDYVVLDLACNGGGVLAGVYHLLNYLTNDNISIFTKTLGARSSWTYAVEGDLAIDAEFFIMTSSVTYSAANLFTAMAKEKGLARTLGEKSGGGACSIKTVVLPNGAILQMSSNMNLSFSTYETVEEGVDVDYDLPFSENGAAKIESYFVSGVWVNADYPTLAELLAIVQGMQVQ